MTAPRQCCDLGGTGVLVTRPAHQAGPLCAWIEASGGQAIRFPAIEIQAAASRETRARLGSAADYDRLVFVSANAVYHALPFLPPERTGAGIAAVGESTARALTDAGFCGVLTPATRADSEGLLALPELANASRQRILIVRGSGGRTLLGDELRARGATVDYAEVYRRAIPAADPAPLLARWQTDIGAVTVTSGEILDNLVALLGRDRRLLETPLVVISPRIAGLAARRGFATVVTAAGAHEQAIVEALCTLAGARMR